MKKIIPLFLAITFFSTGTTNTASTRIRAFREMAKLKILIPSGEKLKVLEKFNIGNNQEFWLLQNKHSQLIDSMVRIGLQEAVRRDAHANSFQLHPDLTNVYNKIGFPEKDGALSFEQICLFYKTFFEETLTEESYNTLIKPIVEDQNLSVFEKIIALKEMTTVSAIKTSAGIATLLLISFIAHQF